jgi:hypothetical protein
MPSLPLSALHLSLLARGAVRLDGAILPTHREIPELAEVSEAAADELVHQKFAVWINVAQPSIAWKRLRRASIGLVITDLGRAALDALEVQIAQHEQVATKIGRIIEMLGSREGASLVEIIFATGWKPHSARAALTTLRKRGFAIRKEAAPKGREPRYRLALEVAR